jgi:hypothetical protein
VIGQIKFPGDVGAPYFRIHIRKLKCRCARHHRGHHVGDHIGRRNSLDVVVHLSEEYLGINTEPVQIARYADNDPVRSLFFQIQATNIRAAIGEAARSSSAIDTGSIGFSRI